MNTLEQIQKMNRETCVKELRICSTLNGDENEEELNKILERCQCIQIGILLNGFRHNKEIAKEKK